jgi:hypothetical protein
MDPTFRSEEKLYGIDDLARGRAAQSLRPQPSYGAGASSGMAPNMAPPDNGYAVERERRIVDLLDARIREAECNLANLRAAREACGSLPNLDEAIRLLHRCGLG